MPNDKCPKCGGDNELCCWEVAHGDGGTRCRIKELENEVERLKRINFELANAESKEERVAMLLKDAARLDWLENHLERWDEDISQSVCVMTVREAIDAAMKRGN